MIIGGRLSVDHVQDLVGSGWVSSQGMAKPNARQNGQKSASDSKNARMKISLS